MLVADILLVVLLAPLVLAGLVRLLFWASGSTAPVGDRVAGGWPSVTVLVPAHDELNLGEVDEGIGDGEKALAGNAVGDIHPVRDQGLQDHPARGAAGRARLFVRRCHTKPLLLHC